MGLSETLKAISDPVRRDILNMLKEEKKSAGEIAERFNLTGATVSYHLSQLKKAELIVETKYKNFKINFYSLKDILIGEYSKVVTTFKLNKLEHFGKIEKEYSNDLFLFLECLEEFSIIGRDEDNYFSVFIIEEKISDKKLEDIYIELLNTNDYFNKKNKL